MNARSALVMAACILAGAPVDAEPVELDFAWPAGLEADVTFTGTRVRTLDGRDERRTVRGSYRLSTRRAADGLLIDVGEMRVEEPAAAGRAAGELLREMVARLSNVVPDTVIGDDGSLLRVVGADATARRLRGAIDDALRDEPPELRARVSAAIEGLLTPARIEASVRSDWGRDIGAWAGLRVEPGTRYEGEVGVPVPLLPGASVPASVSYRLIERGPCPAPASDRDCVVLEMRTEVTQARTRAVLEGLGARLSARAGRAVHIASLTIHNRARLTTEPATLLPHVIEYEQRTGIGLTSAGAPDRNMSQSEQRRTEYRYR